MNATTRSRAPLSAARRLLGAPRRALGRGMAHPAVLRRGMNLWPPFLGAGVVVEELDGEWRAAQVRLRRSRLTANYVGTQFGGSLFSMCDPWFMLLVLRRLGPGYVVWDRRGDIEFVAPGRTAVRARFEVSDERIAAIKEAAAGGDKVLEWFEADVRDSAGALVARYRKQVYVRAKRS